MLKCWSLLIGLALFTVACQSITAPHTYKGNPLDPPVALSNFELKTTDGSAFRLSDLEGKVALIFFGYTNCSDVCPLTVADVRQALNTLDETDREKVQFVFISVDPERDTPEVLARYLNAFDPSFIGLTDDFAKTQEVMKPFWAYAEKEKPAASTSDQSHANHNPEDQTAAYLVAHIGRVYVVNPKREMILMYPAEFKAEDLGDDLVQLLKQR
jgi:protein SCO1